jgi:hypothetical protein
LLAILRRQGHRLPKDARTLLSTPKSVDIQDKCGGEYKYFGLESGIVRNIAQSRHFAQNCNSVDLLVNVDGLPLYKSVRGDFWPILCKFSDFDPFMVALFYGKSMPQPLDAYLRDFLDELRELQQNDILYEGKYFHVTVKGFVCDAPARAYLKCTKKNNAKAGCERCQIKGTWEGRVVFNTNVDVPQAAARIDEGFRNFDYKDHQIGQSPLVDAGICCVSGFVLDYMHLVCLGCIK